MNDALFQTAVQHHQAGRLAEAQQLYRQILAQEPRHADALHLLGLICGQSGDFAVASEFISRAIAANPQVAGYYLNLGVFLMAQGRSDQAMAAYRKVIELAPDMAEGHNNLGNALQSQQQLDEAVACFERAIALKADYAEAHSNLGNALKDQGQLAKAIAAHRRAIALRPDYAEAYANLGNALKDKGQLDDAIAAYRQALAIKPDNAEFHSNLGNALRDNGQLEEAIAACRQAIVLQPNFSDAYNNLGAALRDGGQFDDAIAACRQAIALRPDYAEAYNNLGNALKDKSQLDDAIAAYRQALRLKPDCAEAHFNLALALLLCGQWEQGWREFEWRWKLRDFASLHRGFSQPLWDGSDLKGRAIMLHAEQGMGDAIQFIRYLPLVVARSGLVFVEAQAELISLLRQLPGVQRWIARGEERPAFDVQCPLLSLPRLLATTPQTVPLQKDLLRPEANLAQAWRRRLEQQPPGLRVGLVWGGSPKHKNDRNRSITLSRLAPLATVEGIHFYSLQKGEAAGQTAHPPPGMRIMDWTDEFHDFADTAALIAQLDLVIAVDTAVAHLAGAMGKAVWVLLPFVPDWRWMLKREDSPWYPSMRLLRQKRPGDWSEVICRVVAALAAFPAEREKAV